MSDCLYVGNILIIDHISEISYSASVCDCLVILSDLAFQSKLRRHFSD